MVFFKKVCSCTLKYYYYEKFGNNNKEDEKCMHGHKIRNDDFPFCIHDEISIARLNLAQFPFPGDTSMVTLCRFKSS